MPEPVIFNRLESAADIGCGVIGEVPAIHGTPTYAAGKFGNGILLDANSEHLVFTTWVPLAAGTIECWVKPAFDSNSATNNVIADRDDSNQPRFLLYWRTDKRWAFSMSDPSGYCYSSGWTHAANDLIHIAGVWDAAGIAGSANKVRLYLNGVMHGTSNTGWAAHTHSIVIGVQGTNSTLTFNGVIDNLKIHNYAITDWTKINIERANLNDQEILV